MVKKSVMSGYRRGFEQRPLTTITKERQGIMSVLYIVRLWDGFDGEWIDISEPLSQVEAEKLAGDENENRLGSAAGKRDGNYSDIDYYKAFPADTTMYFSEGRSQTR